ncbi:MAG TPA: FimV/HubP family polar landmark protein [Novimethylophilus sp.]|uniref:FimV/HubP family polar landmark protein n=1 Tax=Novimethylophilus sp. TaxID=2137426 RepID=UPI002F3E7C9E
MPIASYAAGLGKLTVISGLGEPLSAEVELLSTTKDELASLSAQIASSAVFAEQGVERAAVLSAVRVEVSKRPDGTPVLRLSSSQPISDPFLDMLIQVEWSSGRLLREYTALLDPPGYGDRSATTSAAALPGAGAAQAAPVPGASTEKISRKGKTHKGAAAQAPVDTVSTEKPEGHMVQKGDTLRAIASQSQVEGVSLEQMLVGLYRANKEAFAGGNMNRLKVGQIIHVPAPDELQAVTQGEAVKEIRVQTANWNAYRNKLAGMVAESAPAREEPSSQTASGKITAPAEDKSAVPAQGPRDVVRLSKSESGAVAKGGAADVASRLTALQEEATAREKAIKEADARVSVLDKQLQDMQKLLEIKNKSLAEAQKGAKEPAAATQEAPKPAPGVTPPQEVPVAQIAKPVPEPAKPAAEQAPEAPKAEAKPQEKTPKKIVRPQPLPPKSEPGIFDTLLDNPLLLAAGGGGLLALIGGMWFYLRNKRRKGLDSFEQGILTTGGLKPNTVFGNTAGGTVDTGNTSFLTDFGQGATAGMIDTNDVDPIAEAEVYMAYGRDVQAEEILKDALAKEPKRHELHLKLLEIFANRKDTAAFETLAGELYAALGATDATWARVAEMGRKLEPDNPLYGESASHPKAEVSAVDFDATMIQQAPPPVPDSLDLSLGAEDATLDFSLDEAVADTTAGALEPATENNALDFDIGGLELTSKTPQAAAVDESLPDLDVSVADLELPASQESGLEPAGLPGASVEQETAGLDFQLDLPEPAAEENAQLDVADLGVEALPDLPETETPVMEESSGGISLDLPELDVPASGEASLAEQEQAVDLALPELELPALQTAETGQPETMPQESAAQQASESSFDLSALDMPEPMSDSTESAAEAESSLPDLDVSVAETGAAEEVSLDLPAKEPAQVASLDMDLTADLQEPPAAAEEAVDIDQSMMSEMPVESAVTEIELEEAPAEAASGLDFNFDVDLGEPEQPANTAEAAATELPDLDLSGINLDVADADTMEMAGATEEITLSASESPDVDTKLDLVTAYIDMGDQEGARELLQEVLKEGGPTQREKAQKLLEGLD